MKRSGQPLWAPWRGEFIHSRKSGVCFLCGNEQPAENKPEEELIVTRMRHCFIMLNRYPYNCGHLLVVPYRHTGDLSALEKEELHELMDGCVAAKETLLKAMAPDAFNIGFNLGAAAGAGVAEHLYLHIVPRWNGDTNFMSVISSTRVIPETLARTAELLRAFF